MKIRKLEFLVTHECHWGCQDCYRAVNVCYPANSHVTAEQTARFIKYLKEIDLHVEILKINGGEPLCNPELEEICRLLFTEIPGMFNKIKLYTAYPRKAVRAKLNLADRIRLVCDPQTAPKFKPNHTPHFLSPAEHGITKPEDPPPYGSNLTKRRCKLQINCGPCFDRWGFTASGMETTLGRILGIPVHSREFKPWGNPDVCRHCILSTYRSQRNILQLAAINGSIPRVDKVFQMERLEERNRRVSELPPW